MSLIRHSENPILTRKDVPYPFADTTSNRKPEPEEVLNVPPLPDMYGNAPAPAKSTCSFKGAIFRMKLPAGPRHLRAQFSASAPGFYSSAYYVYVRRIGR